MTIRVTTEGWKLLIWTEFLFFIFNGTLFNHEIYDQACKEMCLYCKYGLNSPFRTKLIFA